MLSITVKSKLDELAKAVGTEGPKKIRQQTAIAMNATSKLPKRMLAKEVYQEIALAQKHIAKTIDVTVKATSSRLRSVITARHGKRISLRDFGARQTKKGVTYKVSRKKGRKTIDGAFILPRYSNQAFTRKSKERTPILRPHGPSPWGVIRKHKLDKLVAKRDVEPELIRQVERRIRAIQFKRAQG